MLHDVKGAMPRLACGAQGAAALQLTPVASRWGTRKMPPVLRPQASPMTYTCCLWSLHLPMQLLQCVELKSTQQQLQGCPHKTAVSAALS